LKGCRRVCETKEHYRRLKESFTGFEGGFPLISLFDADVVISPSYIEFGEQVVSSQVVDEVVNQWERVPVWYSPFVQVSVVLYWTELSIFLSNEKETTGIGGV
jgi:hypothetical protein